MAQRTTWRRARACLLVAATAAAGACGAQSIGLSAVSDRHSDPVALSRLDDEHAPLDPRSGRNLVYLRDELRLSMRLPTGGDEQARGGSYLEWSVLWRQAATLTASSGALRLKNQLDGHASGATAQDFDVRLRYDGFSGYGLGWQFVSRPPRGWHWGVSAQALRLRRLERITLDGAAQTVPGSELGYAFGLHATRADDGLDFDYQRPFPGQGLGLIAGAQAGWCEEGWCAGARLEDLGWLRWKDLPEQEARLQTTAPAVDADGYLNVTPLIQGRNRQGGRTRTTPRTWTAYAQWQAAAHWRLDAELQTIGGFGPLPRVGAAWDAVPGLQLGAQWRFHERRVTLWAEGRWWRVAAGADSLDGHARSMELSARAFLPLP